MRDERIVNWGDLAGWPQGEIGDCGPVAPAPLLANS